jgi:hypothetical protein
MIVYANDNNLYPSTLQVLRQSGYANVPDNDPWNNRYTISPTTGTPAQTDDVWSCSGGPAGAGCPAIGSLVTSTIPTSMQTGSNGSVGYSSMYGSWTGS